MWKEREGLIIFFMYLIMLKSTYFLCKYFQYCKKSFENHKSGHHVENEWEVGQPGGEVQQ